MQTALIGKVCGIGTPLCLYCGLFGNRILWSRFFRRSLLGLGSGLFGLGSGLFELGSSLFGLGSGFLGSGFGLYVRAVDGVVVCIEHFGDLFVILINIKTLGKNDFFAGERNGATGAIENVHTVQIFAVAGEIKHTC